MGKRSNVIIVIIINAVIVLASYFLCQPRTNEITTTIFNVIGITIFFYFIVIMAKFFDSLEIEILQNSIISKIPYIICIPYLLVSILCFIPLVTMRDFTVVSIIVSAPIALRLSNKASKILSHK